LECEYQEKISEYLDGMLEKDQAEELEKHFDSCPACSSFLQDMISIKAEMNGVGALKASGVRRAVMKKIKSEKEARFFKIASGIAAAVIIIVALPVFLGLFSQNTPNASDDGKSLNASATDITDTGSVDKNSSELDLFFADAANAGQTKSIYGYTCTYQNASDTAIAPDAATEQTAEGSADYAETTQTSAAPVGIRYSIIVSGFDADAQKLTLRKALIALSAPASSDVLITQDGSIPLNIFDALQLISSYDVNIQILYNPAQNNLEAQRIQLVLN